MSINIIVDGYNMIRNSAWLVKFDRQNISLGRSVLIKTLVAYKQCKKHGVTVVFDAANVPCIYCQRDRINGIEIVFSRENQTADQFICSMVKKEKERAIVVSYDREIITFAESCGACVITPIDFENRIIKAIDNNSAESYNTLTEVHTNSKFITRKKGPRRKLPKNKRKQMIKIEKL